MDHIREHRSLFAAGAIAAARDPWAEVAGRRMLLLDISGLITTAGLAVVFIASAVRDTRALYLAEPLPGGRHGGTRTVSEPSVSSCL
jgi:hypothetical protein